MQILNAVQEELDAGSIDEGSTAELVSAEFQALRKSVMIVANALDMEVDIRLAKQERAREVREAQKKVRSVDQIRVDNIARDRAIRRPSAPTRLERHNAAMAARKVAAAEEVIDSAVKLLQDVMDSGTTAALRDALDSEYGVSRDA